ncbi:uncharacterized protein J3R85_009889 [Psidium guajava]|nr:uncharacterized protein J3R85_009889 [Psidium guajava]
MAATLELQMRSPCQDTDGSLEPENRSLFSANLHRLAQLTFFFNVWSKRMYQTRETRLSLCLYIYICMYNPAKMAMKVHPSVLMLSRDKRSRSLVQYSPEKN